LVREGLVSSRPLIAIIIADGRKAHPYTPGTMQESKVGYHPTKPIMLFQKKIDFWYGRGLSPPAWSSKAFIADGRKAHPYTPGTMQESKVGYHPTKPIMLNQKKIDFFST